MGKPMCYGRIAAILMVIAAVILQKLLFRQKKSPATYGGTGRDEMSIMNKSNYYSDW